jgi:group I intron endonuclease
MKIYTIYKATCQANGKIYIGFTSRWPNRINGHNYDRRYGNANSKAFYNAIKKYGWDSFLWEAIYQSLDYAHTLKEMEPFFIDKYRSWVGFEDCNGYNTTKGGEGTLGYKRTTELIESHRKQLQGRKQTANHIEKRVAKMKQHPNFGKSMLNKKHKPETIEKMQFAQKGIPKSESHKQSMRLRPQDTQILVCTHCGKTGDYKNMKRWHMDNCKNNPNRILKETKIVSCEFCGFSAKESPNFYKNHKTNCKKD